jgi:hypothetical protein
MATSEGKSSSGAGDLPIAETERADEFAAFIANDYVKWQQVISRVGIKIE